MSLFPLRGRRRSVAAAVGLLLLAGCAATGIRNDGDKGADHDNKNRQGDNATNVTLSGTWQWTQRGVGGLALAGFGLAMLSRRKLWKGHERHREQAALNEGAIDRLVGAIEALEGTDPIKKHVERAANGNGDRDPYEEIIRAAIGRLGK